jgi:hypothetical protein
MAIEITRRTNGGYTIEVDANLPVYVSQLGYYSSQSGVRLLLPGRATESAVHPKSWLPADWTIQGVTGFTTNEQVSDALDAIGVSPNGSAQQTQVVDEEGGRVKFSGIPVRVTSTVTRPANTSDYAANDAINGSVAAVKQKDTITLTGTEGTATVTVGELAKLATFAADLTTTAANFVTAFAADYLAIGIVLTSSGADLIFEAAVAGVPFPGDGLTGSTIDNVSGDLDGTVVNTTANVTLFPIIFEDCAIEEGGGGFISDVTVITDAVQFALKTIVLALFSEEPVGLVGDNVAYVDNISNGPNYITEVEIPIGAALGSSAVKGTVQALTEFVTSQSKNIWGLIRVKEAVTAPKSAGVFRIHLNIIQL